MSERQVPTEEQDAPGQYEIRIKGHLDDRWSAWFEGMTVTLEENGETLLKGAVADQAALYGLLKKVRDLGMPLVLVKRIRPQPGDRPVNG